MPKQSTKAEYNNFVRGLITEASPLNFPQNASQDEENFELNRDGSRNRRRGMSFEDGYSLLPLFQLPPDLNISSFTWLQAGGDVNTNFFVFQYLDRIYLHNMNAETMSTPGPDILSIYIGFSFDPVFSFCSVNNKLIIAGGNDIIVIVSYDPATKTLSADYQALLVRDVWGVEEQ